MTTPPDSTHAEMPFWLDSPAATFAVYHPPRSPVDGRAVLVCAPFGWEDMGSYPIRRRWARQLADAGHPVLRFDLPGTGHSAGGPFDDHLVAQWLTATTSAARWLRERGSDAVVALGIGFGALLALQAAADGEVDDLVLWGVPSGGRGFVRRQRAFAALQSETGPDDDLPAGAVQTGGFVLAEQTLADISRLRVDRAPAARVRRALVLEGAGPEGEARAAEALRAGGVGVRSEMGPGFAEMFDSPHLTAFPEETVQRIGRWLDDDTAPARDGAGAPAPARPGECMVEHDGVALRETALRIPHLDGATMVGVLTELATEAPVTDTCLVFMSTMAERSIGPNRMWVEMARRHAARGIPSLRIDLLHIGDSDGDPDAMHTFRTVFEYDRIVQVQSTLDALQRRGVGPRFALIGLCTGAYWSLNAAWIDDRIHDLAVFNPAVSATGRAMILRDAATRPMRMLFSLAAWRGLLTGEVSARGGAVQALRGIRFKLAGSRRVPVALEAARIGDPEGQGRSREDVLLDDPALLDPETDLAPSYRPLVQRLAGRGGWVAFCNCHTEPANRLLEIEGLRDAPPANVIVSVLSTVDHNLRSVGEQRAAHAIVDRLVTTIGAPSGASSSVAHALAEG